MRLTRNSVTLDPMPRPDRPNEDANLADLVTRLSRTLRFRFAEACEPLGLSPHQVRALHVVATGDGARLNVLADRLHVAPRSATEVVDALEAKGLVARTPDPADRRATLVGLTEAGREVHASAHEIRGSVHTDTFSHLTGDEQAQLRALLIKALA